MIVQKTLKYLGTREVKYKYLYSEAIDIPLMKTQIATSTSTAATQVTTAVKTAWTQVQTATTPPFLQPGAAE